MLRNYFKIAWRNLIKSKGYSAINIGGLAIGIAATLLISLWVYDELTYNDHIEHRDKIALVLQNETFNGEVLTHGGIPRALETALRTDYDSYFKHIAMASFGKQTMGFKDVSISREGLFVQSGGPDMFSLEILKGKRNGVEEVNSIMLSESTAKALFGDKDPVGKIVKVNTKYNVKVTAVYKDFPVKSSFKGIEYVMPWAFYVKTNRWVKKAENNWSNNSFQLYVQIADNTTMAALSSKIKDLKKNLSKSTKKFNPELFLFPMNDWHLRWNFEGGKQTDGGRIKYVRLFSIIGLLILLLACINFVNLNTARSEKRAMEVGVRKAIGSSRNALIYQFLSESFLVVCLAYSIAVVIVQLSLYGFNELVNKHIYFPWDSALFWLGSLVFIMLITFISGGYPALYLSSFKPVSVLKGVFRPERFSMLPRKILVVAQFTVSVVFIIGTIVVMQQIQFSKDRPVGYNKNGLIQIPTANGRFYGKDVLMRNEFLRSGAVVEMATSTSPTTAIESNESGFLWEGKPEGFVDSFAWTKVSHEYAQTIGLKIVEGRDFSKRFSTDSSAVLINEAAVKYMGLKNPVGTYLKSTGYHKGKWKIIGVVENMITQSPYEPVKQAIYAFNKRGDLGYYNLRLNPEKSMSANLKLIEKVFKQHFPNSPFEYQFIDEEYGRKFAEEERISNLASLFTLLAIFISCLGLFGLTSYVVEQRTKEIGVRKILGASISNLWIMLSKNFVGLVILSCVLAVPIAYYYMNAWLLNFEYRINVSWSIFVVSIAGAILMTLITISFHISRIARANPINSLRTE
ncbi:ABC transporter permease [uncultured Algibacter sp.]|uniref:ABC transporter permease n=1 Tax=uncultured Algibacter sp. TaxID=298659 RepID=UPI0026302728|nr:ABC transporter permease [uncultured Algibacter sp.]